MSRAAKVVVQNEFLAVIDDVLSSEQRDGLWNYFQLQPFQRIDALGMQGQWSLEDSGVLRGPTVGWGRGWDAQYPTGTPIDHVIKAVVECETEIASVVGPQGVVWDIFSAFPTIHVAGQGRLWHRDTDDDAGSWVYYAHREWNIEWGGELFLSHERAVPAAYGAFLHRLRPMADHPDPPGWKSHIDNEDANALLMERGIGSYVAPKPNRLVLIKGGTPQALAKVRASAGRHVHATVGGVFKKKI
jgi:hypothetical protein